MLAIVFHGPSVRVSDSHPRIDRRNLRIRRKAASEW